MASFLKLYYALENETLLLTFVTFVCVLEKRDEKNEKLHS